MCVPIGGGFDFTCVNQLPLLNPDTDYTRIGGYKSGSDTHADVEFSRVVETGTGSGLPNNSVAIDHPSVGTRARILEMPISGGTERIGAFYCEGSNTNVTYNVPTIINHVNGKTK